MNLFYISLLALTTIFYKVHAVIVDECSHLVNWDENDIINLSTAVIPELEGKRKGEAGKIAVVGGSSEYTGAPYFAAITALKVGADLVYIITTENAAPIIKSYSPDLIVIPHTSLNISSIISTVHIVVIGPGLGRAPEGLNLAYEVIKICKDLQKPLVIDADGLYAISNNPLILKDYPSPGAILTPNNVEIKRLQKAVSEQNVPWNKYWGNYITILQKGEKDIYYSSTGKFDWSLQQGGSGRRAAGQGDILAGALGTFFNWALKANLCENANSVELAQSIASFAAAKFTRTCNEKAYKIFGRNMIASNMLNEIHTAFDELFL